ncbi:MAG: lytic murein transglycosylase, partial [Candidatus Electrothrix sp. AR4]|nr:lytic murein transglycosylase [Candidatus Electrothrix sp. AR4]
MHRLKLYTKAVVFVVFLGISIPVFAATTADNSFQDWLKSFYPIVAKQGISRSLYERAFSGVRTPDSDVLRKAAYQPEFTKKIWDYLDTGVNPVTVANGRAVAGTYRRWLDTLEARFGVESSVLLAIWSMESGYGAVLQRPGRLHYVPRALATLAYADTSRRRFGEKQLIAALKIVQNGDVSFDQLYGSWAGAMGHTQFIPTSYLAYGVDMDKDGRRDIWNSVPDALGTVANLLSKNGWRTGTE